MDVRLKEVSVRVRELIDEIQKNLEDVSKNLPLKKGLRLLKIIMFSICFLSVGVIFADDKFANVSFASKLFNAIILFACFSSIYLMIEHLAKKRVKTLKDSLVTVSKTNPVQILQIKDLDFLLEFDIVEHLRWLRQIYSDVMKNYDLYSYTSYPRRLASKLDWSKLDDLHEEKFAGEEAYNAYLRIKKRRELKRIDDLK